VNTVTTERPDEGWEGYQDEGTEQLPRRPRRQFFNRRSAALGALITCAIGFYAGVRVEKGQLASSGGTSLSTGLTSAAGRGTTGRTGASGRTGATGRSGAASLFGSGGSSARSGAFGGGSGGFAGAGAFGAAGGGSATVGTVASVSGKTIDVTETSGNTVKVNLNSATKISKTQSARKSAIHPGDTIVVEGVSGSGGTVSAASVTDSGNRTSGSTSSGSGSGSGSTGSGSGIKSLF